jgi:hypothetical protein
MNKITIAFALLTAFSLPAMAADPVGQTFVHDRHARAMPDRTSQEMPRSAQHRFKDPYWTPCDYSTSWTVNSCE